MATVAVVLASGFEQAELTGICSGLKQVGHRCIIVSTKKHDARSWDNTRWNGDVPVDVAAIDARAEDYAAMVMPGGLISADTLRSDSFVVRLVADAARAGKPVAAMGHAAWVLIEAGLVDGRRVTAHPAIRTDLANAGGVWTDRPVVEDGGIITGRHTHDLATFVETVGRAV